MPDDLFGPHNAAWERFKTLAPKKRSRFVPAPVPPVQRREPDDIDRKIQQHRAEDAYYSALETLPRWKHRMSAEDYAKLQAHVAAMKPPWVTP